MNKREEEKLKRQQEKLKKELERTEAMSVYEKEHSDCQYICGIDEVGRGHLQVLWWQVRLSCQRMTRFCI